MPKLVKYALLGMLGLLGLAALAIAVFAANFNPNDYKPQIIQLVQEKKQRTLAIPGEIKLTFFPKIGADLGKVSLSEHRGGKEFASIDSAKLSLALFPLLSKQLVVDHVKVDGIRANIRRNRDGSTNFDDLLSKDDASEGQVKFDIDGITLTNARIAFDDLQQQRRIELSNLALETGKIANNADSRIELKADVKATNPKVDARIDMKSGLRFDLDTKRYALKGADAQFKGSFAEFSQLAVKLAGNADFALNEKRFSLSDIALEAGGKKAAQSFDLKLDAPKLALTDQGAAGGKISGQAKLIEGPRTIQAKFSVPSFEGSPQAFKLPSLSLEAMVKDGRLDVKADLSGSFAGNMDKLLFSSPQLKLALSGKQGDTAISGTLSSSFSADLKTQRIEFPALNAALSLPNPAGGAMKVNAQGRAGADLGKSSASLALKGKLDESSFDARLGMNGFSPAAYTFDIGIDRLNADRYRSKTASSSAASSGQASAGAAEPLDLSGMKDLRANGSVRIGALTVNNIKASNVRADLQAGGGRLVVNPLSASLYGGNASGAVLLTASKAPHIGLRQTLAGINVGPLLKDAVGKDPVEGRGNVVLDVTTEGGGFVQWKRNLDGLIRLELRDGAVKGINVAQAVRNAKAGMGALQGNEAARTGTSSAAEKTDFSEMTGSFRINDGVARNDDLSIKSPLVRIGGSGSVDLGADRLDYLAKATVVSTLQGQGGPELQALKGLTVPVRLSGPFSAIGWRIDFAGMASELAKQKLDERKDEVKARVQKQLEKQKDKTAEQLLKGLFGK